MPNVQPLNFELLLTLMYTGFLNVTWLSSAQLLLLRTDARYLGYQFAIELIEKAITSRRKPGVQVEGMSFQCDSTCINRFPTSANVDVLSKRVERVNQQQDTISNESNHKTQALLTSSVLPESRDSEAIAALKRVSNCHDTACQASMTLIGLNKSRDFEDGVLNAAIVNEALVDVLNATTVADKDDIGPDGKEILTEPRVIEVSIVPPRKRNNTETKRK